MRVRENRRRQILYSWPINTANGEKLPRYITTGVMKPLV